MNDGDGINSNIVNKIKMKSYILRKYGAPNVLNIEDSPEPVPGTEEIRVKIEKLGLNYAEVQSRKGLYGWAPKLPYTLGMEAVGTVDMIGESVKNKKVGEKVIVGCQYGTYAEKIVIPERQALPPIISFSDDENTAFPVNYLTAWVALMKVARLKSNDTVLIHAAAGGVGTAAVQIAKKFGCYVIGTASKNEKIELLNDLGIDMAINYLHEDFEEVIKRKINNNGVDVVLEVVGGDVFKKSMKLLNPFGRTVVAGFASLNLKKMNPISWVNTWKDIPRAKVADLAESSTGLLATHLGYLLNNESLLREVWDELVTFTIKHGIKPIIGHRFEFDELSKAHELMESRNSHGKIIISLPSAL